MRAQAQVPAAATTGRQLVIDVFGAKGGVGATTIAANLAGALQRQRRSASCLLDLDLHLGDVLSFLDLRGELLDHRRAREHGRLDRELLATSMMRHASGVHVLAQSGKIEEAEHSAPGRSPACWRSCASTTTT